MAKIHVDIEENLKHDLKVIAAKKNKKIRAIITELVKAYIGKNKT